MDKIKQLLTRGVDKIINQEHLEKQLRSGKKLRLYYGIDPTSPKLHLGHAITLWKLRAFQELGHQIILLIGDFTARIGDPTDQDSARQVLSKSEVEENMETYQEQAKKILNLDKVELVYNSQWLEKLNFSEVVKLATHFTVQQMLQRDMFKKRLDNNQPISLQEFFYPLMQGYDSVALDVDLEVAGSDQLFNMLAGRTLQEIYHNKEKDVLTMKLLIGLDGRKMSKTYQNTVPLTIKPGDMFGKIMSMKDELMGQYFELTTRLPQKQIKEVLSGDPRKAKAKLAREIVTLYHGKKEAIKAEKEFERVFKKSKLPEEMPEYRISRDSSASPQNDEQESHPEQSEGSRGFQYDIVDLLAKTKLASSKSEAKRLIEQGGIKLNKKPIKDWHQKITIKDGDVLQRGKRKFVELKL